MALTLTTDERAELERRVRSLKIRSEDASRTRVIPMLASGDSYSRIEATIRATATTSIGGVDDSSPIVSMACGPRYRGQPPTVFKPAMEARALEKTRQAPPDGSTHWSTCKGRPLKIHHNLVRKASEPACSPIGSLHYMCVPIATALVGKARTFGKITRFKTT